MQLQQEQLLSSHSQEIEKSLLITKKAKNLILVENFNLYTLFSFSKVLLLQDTFEQHI